MFSPFATSDRISIFSTAPSAKTPNLGVLVNALAVKYHYYFFLISSIKPTLYIYKVFFETKISQWEKIVTIT